MEPIWEKIEKKSSRNIKDPPALHPPYLTIANQLGFSDLPGYRRPVFKHNVFIVNFLGQKFICDHPKPGIAESLAVNFEPAQK